MFTTFSSNGGSAARTSDAPRAKRNQVARACDFCRLNRVKCDDRLPCKNCENRGANCTHSRSKDFQTLVTANRENKQLEARIKDLEEQLKHAKPREVLPPSPSSAATKDIEEQHKQSKDRDTADSPPDASKKQTGGGQGQPAESVNNDPNLVSYHGASSVPRFVNRISAHLQQSLEEPFDTKRLQPICASAALASPTSTLTKGLRPEFGYGEETEYVLQQLDRPQEEMFLNLFWQHYHLLCPVICEVGFEEHYKSLWMNLPPGRSSARRASPLIDSMLAICMQYGAMLMASHEDTMEFDGFSQDDASIAGRGYFARAQSLLEYDLETPTISTLQSLLFSTIFLWDASFINQADSMLAKTVRVAYILGFEKPPSESLEPGLRSLHRRLWWAIYINDTRISMAMGRPFLTETAAVQCFQDDAYKVEVKDCRHQYSDGDDTVGPYDYFTQCTKLALAVRHAFTILNERGSDFNHGTAPMDMQRNPKLIEDLASIMPRAMKRIDDWTEQVPRLLNANASASNKPFSPFRSTLIDLDHHQPLWLQRQQVYLLTQYHEYVMLLNRPFVRLPPTAVSLTPLSDGIGISCLKHAMAIISIIQHLSNESEILKGCHQSYRTQWNATLSILGWLLGNPLGSSTKAARKAFQNSASTFDGLGNCVAFAKSAAAIVRDMDSLLQTFIPNMRSNSRTSSKQNSATPNPPPSANFFGPFPSQSSSGQIPPSSHQMASPLQPQAPYPTPAMTTPTLSHQGPLNQNPMQNGQFDMPVTLSQDFLHNPNLFDDILSGPMGGFWPHGSSMPMGGPPNGHDPQLSAMVENWDSTADVR